MTHQTPTYFDDIASQGTVAAPTTITANGRTILLLRDLGQYTYLREIETNKPFKQGFPDLSSWECVGTHVVAVESPYVNDAGQTLYRIWLSESGDNGTPPDRAVPEAVVPSSITPGAPSISYTPNPDGYTLYWAGMQIRPDQMGIGPTQALE